MKKNLHSEKGKGSLPQKTNDKQSENHIPKIQTLPVWAIVVISICGGFLISFLYLHASSKSIRPEADINATQQEHALEQPFSYTNPALNCTVKIDEIRPFKDKIVQYLNQAKAEGLITSASMIFRELKDGYYCAINENENYWPASLLKVPTMIAILKSAETHPELLEKKIKYVKAQQKAYQYIIKDKIQEGQTYTVRELVERMIKNSDNEAYLLLFNDMDQFELKKVYNDFGIELPTDEHPKDYMKVGDYARFFRVLYNASYLNKKMSNYALEILSQSDFKDGLVKGVGNKVTVSHKFGERSDPNDFQLHDVGVVYLQDEPYILGVMTKGKDFNKMATVIQNVSKKVFESVQENMDLN